MRVLRRDAEWHQMAPGGDGAVAGSPPSRPTSLARPLSDTLVRGMGIGEGLMNALGDVTLSRSRAFC